MMIRRPESNSLALAILALLSERPTHPYEMSVVMRARYWHNSIKLNYGSLYSVIDRLEQKGLIRKVETEREGNRPDRTIYDLTSDGRVEFHDWLTEMLGKPAKEFLKFQAGLTLMLHLPINDALTALDSRLKTLKAEVDDFQAQLTALRERVGLSRMLLLEAEYELHLKQAEFGWLQKLVIELKSGELVWPSPTETSPANG